MTGDGIVLLHGISRTALSFRKMQLALERAGYATLNIDYPSRRAPLETLAENIHPAIELFVSGLGRPVHFVGHSMGGVAGACLSRAPPAGAAWPRRDARQHRTAVARSPIA